MPQRFVLPALITLVLLPLAAQRPAAGANGEHISSRPAATLLLPYFEVALPKQPGGKAKGVTTIFSVYATDSVATVAHVTIWSDLGVPVTLFHLYLTGYDVQIVDLGDVLDGRLPITADDGQDPLDTISPQGPVSQDINFLCSGVLPPPEALPVESVEHMRAALTGEPSPLFGGQCLGRNYDEKQPIARGYVTIDSVIACSFLFPSSPGYFGPGGIARERNNLSGDYVVFDRSKKTTYGDSLVHIRADATDPTSDAPGDYTFYSGFVASTAVDNRQPLATNFAGRFVNDPKDPIFPRGTSIIAWRDPKVVSNPFNCDSRPSYFPLVQEQIVAFDEQENVEEPMHPPIPSLPPEPILPFPGAAQKTAVGSEELPVSFLRGFLYLNLNTIVVGQSGGSGFDPSAAAAFVTMLHQGRKGATAVRAAQLDSAASASHPFIPVP